MRVTRRFRVVACGLGVLGGAPTPGAFAQVPGPPMQLGPPALVLPQRVPRPEPVTPLSGVPILRQERPFTPQVSPIRPIPRKQRIIEAPLGASGQALGAGPLMPGPGFTMIMAGDAPPKPDSSTSLQRPRDVARAMRICWRPPAHSGKQEITVRLAFNRDGSVLGTPKITYVQRDLPADQKTALRQSLLDAIGVCAPFRFTPGLASAIAGRPFAIRFVVPASGGPD